MTEYRALIEQIAGGHGIDPDLVEAVVIQESQACTDAFRYEPGFYERYLKGKPEYAGQNKRRISSSYGLCQVMFPTAQQYGFNDQPEVLFIPDTGLHYGCLHLRAMLRAFDGDTRKALEGYNGGRGNVDGKGPDAAYAVKVLKLYASVQAVHA
jgi:soluble lytic murein transglycosylase-like protein